MISFLPQKFIYFSCFVFVLILNPLFFSHYLFFSTFLFSLKLFLLKSRRFGPDYSLLTHLPYYIMMQHGVIKLYFIGFLIFFYYLVGTYLLKRDRNFECFVLT